MNQICLAITVVFFTAVTLLAFFGNVSRHAKSSEVIGGMICPGIFIVVPAIVLVRSRRKSSRSRIMSAVVRSHSGSGRGFPDITLSSGQKLPKVCIRCGASTRRVSRLDYASAYTDASPYEWGRANALLGFRPFFRIIVQLMIVTRIWQSIEKRWKRRKEQGDGVLFKIPHCKACAVRHPILQKHFDFHGRVMIVEAHPAFRDRLGAMSVKSR